MDTVTRIFITNKTETVHYFCFHHYEMKKFKLNTKSRHFKIVILNETNYNVICLFVFLVYITLIFSNDNNNWPKKCILSPLPKTHQISNKNIIILITMLFLFTHTSSNIFECRKWWPFSILATEKKTRDQKQTKIVH